MLCATLCLTRRARGGRTRCRRPRVKPFVLAEGPATQRRPQLGCHFLVTP
jgi:hypothetical protein